MKLNEKLNYMRRKANVPARILIEEIMMISNNCPTTQPLRNLNQKKKIIMIIPSKI